MLDIERRQYLVMVRTSMLLFEICLYSESICHLILTSSLLTIPEACLPGFIFAC